MRVMASLKRAWPDHAAHGLRANDRGQSLRSRTWGTRLASTPPTALTASHDGVRSGNSKLAEACSHAKFTSVG